MSPKILTVKDLLIKTPIPKATKSYSPVPHKEMINMTLEEIDKQGLSVTSEHYNIARDGRQGMGWYEVCSPDKDDEMTIRIGWHNSYDKSMPVRWAIGAHIFICGNGMVVGDIGAFKRKHTGGVLQEYLEQVHTYVSKTGEMFEGLKRDRDRMKEIEMSKRVQSELLGRMFFEESLITATQVGIIKKEMENPSYGDYGAPGSVWELYNHCTVAFKEEHPQLFLDRHIKHHKFFKEEFQLA